MTKKGIVFFSMISTILLLTLPSITATDYEAVNNKQNNVIPISTTGCSYSAMLMILNIVALGSVLASMMAFKEIPLVYGIIRTLIFILYLDGLAFITTLAGAYEGPPLWCTPEGWKLLSQEEKKTYMLQFIGSVLKYSRRIRLLNWLASK